MQVVKENQILHKGTRTIDSECATLADLNIFPGDKLWVTDSEVHENRDIAGNLKIVCCYIRNKWNVVLQIVLYSDSIDFALSRLFGVM